MQMSERCVFANEIYINDGPPPSALHIQYVCMFACLCTRIESVRDNFNGLLEKFKIISPWIGARVRDRESGALWVRQHLSLLISIQ